MAIDIKKLKKRQDLIPEDTYNYESNGSKAMVDMLNHAVGTMSAKDLRVLSGVSRGTVYAWKRGLEKTKNPDAEYKGIPVRVDSIRLGTALELLESLGEITFTPYDSEKIMENLNTKIS